MSIAPKDVRTTLEKHMLVDGFSVVVDLERSHGSWIVDAVTGSDSRAEADWCS